MDERGELLELFAVPDTFVSGLGNVEDIGGGCYRFTLFTTQEVHGRKEQVVVAKLIMSAEALPDALHTAAVATKMCACENARRMTRN